MISPPKRFLLCTVLCLLFCEAFLQQRSCSEDSSDYHIYAGCVWASCKMVFTFKDAIEICEKEGGQLATLEKFPTAKDLTDYTLALDYYYAYVGFQRNSSTGKFRWLATGTILERGSFFWGKNQPDSNNLPVVCGRLYRGKVDDYGCYNQGTARYAYCQVFPS